jgi:predicted nucleic acid-binding protein
MRHGLDTCLLVAYEANQHARHNASAALVQQCLSNGDDFALAPQVLAEFVQVLTDANRISQPLSMSQALSRAQLWWTAPEVTQVFPTDSAVNTFVGWMKQHGLGRKRILDTLLGATYFTAGVTSLITTNSSDFRIFGVFNGSVPGRCLHVFPAGSEILVLAVLL